MEKMRCRSRSGGWFGRKPLGLVAGAAGMAALGGAYMFGIAPRWLQVVRVRVRLPGLPTAWDGVRIAHLSDMHAGGKGVRDSLLLRARQAALDFEPDIIAITGDFYDMSARELHHGLFDNWPEGVPVFGVIGNHDVDRGEAWLNTILQQLDEGGVCLLRNTAHPFPLRGETAWVVGVDDPFTLMEDETAAFGALPPGETALLYLAHSPSVVETMPRGRARLLLSGHTHGGQIRIMPSGRAPLINLVWRVTEDGPRSEPPINRGLHWVDGTAVVVSDGVGTSIMPARFRTRPQVYLLELEAAPDTGGAPPEQPFTRPGSHSVLT